MSDILQRLSGSLLYVLIAIGVLVIIVAIIIVIVIMRSARKEPEGGAAGLDGLPAIPGAPPELADVLRMAAAEGSKRWSGTALSNSFKRSIAAIKAYVPGSESRYRIPWVLMLGEAGAGKSTVLENAGLRRAIQTDHDSTSPVKWFFYDQGVVLDVAGDDLIVGDDNTVVPVRSWSNVLHQLRKYRTERPIDAVILTIPATDLVGGDKRSAAQLVQMSSALFEQFRLAQKKLGIRFPIYVLVTKCDRLTGFYSFSKELPEALREDIFGWSSHYSLESAFAPEWVDEAIQSIHTELVRTQVEVLAEKDSLKDSDGVFRFPREFRTLGDPLRVMLSEVFRESAYHETFFFRGVYFTGDTSEVAEREQTMLAAGADTSTAPTGMRQPSFIKQLLERKVFPEAGLAVPVRRTLLARNRAVFAMQVAMLCIVLIGGAGMMWAHRRITAQSEPLIQILSSISDDLNSMADSRPGHANVTSGQMNPVVNMLTKMSNISTGRIWSVFLPASWVSDLNGELAQSLALAFERVILPDMRQSLIERAHTLLAQPVTTVSFDGSSGDLDGDAERLRSFLASLSELGRNIDNFNIMAGEGNADETDLRSMMALVSYLYNQQLPPAFLKDAQLYLDALTLSHAQEIGPSDLPMLETQSLAHAALAINQVYDRLFITLDSANERLNAISSERNTGRASVDNYRRLSAEIGQLQSVFTKFTKSESYWLNPTVPVGGTIRAALDSVPPTPALGGKSFATRFESTFNDIKRDKLQRYTQHFTIATQERDGANGHGPSDASLALSPDVVSLQSALGELFKQKFMQTDSVQPLPPPQNLGQIPGWDAGPLDEALADYTQYQQFTGTSLQKFPPRMKEVVRFAAVRQLESAMNTAVSRAITYLPREDGFGMRSEERNLRTRVANFAPAAKKLTRFLEIYDELGLRESFNGLASILTTQTTDLLRTSDRLLDQGSPYVEVNGTFNWWDGNAAVSQTAFGVTSDDDLADYLSRQRERIRFVANTYAAPLLGVAASPLLAGYIRDAASPQQQQAISRWQGIVQAFDQYDNKVPRNSIAALEGFVLTEMNGVTAPSCGGGTGVRASTSTGGDYFTQARSHLRADLLKRCDDVTHDRAVASYRNVIDIFRTRLAGKFPFAAPTEQTSADPDDVREFFKAYDRFVRLRGTRFSATLTPAAADFITKLDLARAFFSPLMDTDTVAAPMSWDVTATFRTERGSETGAEQIAAQSVDLGNQTIDMGTSDPGKRISWRPGNPVRVSLRWATESAARPIADPASRNASVDGKRVSFTYNDPWGLVRLLADHVRPEYSSRAPHTLLFTVPTETQSVKSKRGETYVPGRPANVYLRVRVFQPVTKAELVLPPLPTIAPTVSTSLRTRTLEGFKDLANAQLGDQIVVLRTVLGDGSSTTIAAAFTPTSLGNLHEGAACAFFCLFSLPASPLRV